MALETGTRIRKTTETEVLPASHSEARPAEFYKRDFWEIIADISRQKLWSDHLVRVYRADDRWVKAGSPTSAEAPTNKFTDNFNEETIRKNWGGGRYLLWLYGAPGGSKIVAEPYPLELEGAAKITGATTIPAGGANGEQGALMLLVQELIAEMRASRGGNLPNEAAKNALDIQATAFKSALTVMPQPSANNTLMDQLLTPLLAALIPALITKFTNPGSPVDDFTKVAEAAQKLVGLLGGGKDVKADALSTIVNALPGVVDKAVGGLREYRLATEAQRDALRIQAGSKIIDMPSQNPPAAATEPGASAPPTAASPTATPAAAPSTPAAAPPKEVVEVLFHQIIFSKIVDAIEKNPNCTGEDLYDFIDSVAPEYISQLAPRSREEIVAFFASEEILRKVANHPRLPKIIDEFLAIAKDAGTKS